MVLSLLRREQELQDMLAERNAEIARLSDDLTTIHESQAMKVQAAVREVQALHEVSSTAHTRKTHTQTHMRAHTHTHRTHTGTHARTCTHTRKTHTQTHMRAHTHTNIHSEDVEGMLGHLCGIKSLQ